MTTGAPGTGSAATTRTARDTAEPPARPAWFTRFTKWVSRVTGRPATFVVAVLAITAWAVTGPVFHFSSDWQLVVNTGTTIVTFLMVFLIQSTQNRDTQALHIKLDELIRATRGARNALLDLEELEEAQLDRFRDRYEALARRARERRGDAQRGTPELDD
jgi:low affinity Fe/Cu permease